MNVECSNTLEWAMEGMKYALSSCTDLFDCLCVVFGLVMGMWPH